MYSNRFGTQLYRQFVGIPMGTNCASLVVDLFIIHLFFATKDIKRIHYVFLVDIAADIVPVRSFFCGSLLVFGVSSCAVFTFCVCR